MRGIARLLFGPEGDRIADLFTPGDHGDHGEHGMAARAREAREWCQTTPGWSGPRSRPRPSQPAFGPRRGRG